MNEPTLTQSQATERVDQLIRETAGALTPKPRLEVLASFNAPTTCADEHNSDGQIVVSRAYWLRDVPRGENMSISRQVRARWQAQGHRIVASGQEGNPDLSGESQPDGFTLTLTWAEGDHLYLGAASTCIWPDGNPPSSR